MFKVGDKVRRVIGWNGEPQKVGYAGRIESISEEGEDRWLNFDDGSRGLERSFELIEAQGPVRTETVTKRHIVPGVYGLLGVGVVDLGGKTVRIGFNGHMQEYLSATPEDLDSLAMVASQLAEALRDGLD